MWYVQAEDRRTGRMVGECWQVSTEQLASATAAGVRLHDYPDHNTYDVCCWEDPVIREIPGGLMLDLPDGAQVRIVS